MRAVSKEDPGSNRPRTAAVGIKPCSIGTALLYRSFEGATFLTRRYCRRMYCLFTICLFRQSEELMRAYPPFVNFFEKSKETLQNLDATRPRFHAFLKISQSKPECGRQTLQDLLIRPVQRLPSMTLLLTGEL